ncbi:MAG TPA: cytochrome c oxidase subunit II [Candidatus Acidoferrales bacterium]|nr:cytochrome c oxidase subunit II [Candidatus Acidoferrales bacterium]
MKRLTLTLAAVAGFATSALANDWGMGESNAKIPPSSIFDPVSTPASQIDTVAYFVLAIAGVIFVIVAGLLAYCIVRYRARLGDDGREPPQVYGSNPIEFAWTTVPVLIVLVLVLVTARTTYMVQDAPRPPGALGVRVIGHQWWWEFRYPSLGIVTANELHVPLSDRADPTPTFLELESADVAHSFWVPRLAGKTDVIPNRKNVMWIDPHQAGTYLGQCGEFCGTEHAMMLLRVVVEPRADFERWAAAQKQAPVQEASATRGREIFETTACVNCHTIRGTDAAGRFGPDLTHLMTRETLGAGVAMNTREHLKIWVTNPGTMKPGALMPAMNLGDRDLDDLVAYLATLR